MSRFASGAVICILLGLSLVLWSTPCQAAERWSVERARDWGDRIGVIRGCNYLPSTAGNSTEIWQAADWREDVIDKELGLAAETGLNSVRVFVQYLVWEQDPKGVLERMDRFLEIASQHGIRTMWVLFDDCAFGYPPKTDPYLGPQGDPKPGEYSPYWTPSPGHSLIDRQASWPQLQAYVRSVVRRFRDDSRVLAWDLYNEPGNSGAGARSHALVDACFEWARAEEPTQPLTVGLYAADFTGAVSRHWMELSDIISFHAYDNPRSVGEKIRFCSQPKRPLVCTECVIRRDGNSYQNLLPMFAEEKVGWYSWGLVQGKSQTWLHWESLPGGPEPEVWQHDLYRSDGSPFDPDEIELIRSFQWLETKVLFPTSRESPQRWRYVEEIPTYGWHLSQYDDSSWYEGLAAFGTQVTPGMPVRTKWNSQNLWLRCSFQFDAASAAHPYLRIRHDEHAEVYLNGVLAAKIAGWNTDYEWVPVSSLARKALRLGKNVIAVHVHQTSGGQGIDVGLTDVLAGAELLPKLQVVDNTEVTTAPGQRWSAKRANGWYQKLAPIRGFNYLPRTAVNSVEMWHADTFDPLTIDEELGWAQAYGYNSARVFLQYAAWEADAEGFLDRFERFLEIADSHAITVMPVFFDDCCFAMKLEPWYMPQDDPVVGIINSGWVPSPGYGPTLDRTAWVNLRRFVQVIVGKYRKDLRVLAWDIYNEPGPFFDVTTSFPLAEAGLGWVRELDAVHPCTIAVWGNPASIRFTELSDINSIHTYGGPDGLDVFAKQHADRPLLVTEWLTRPGPSTFKDMLPVFARHHLGWYHWGLVAGRTQTYYTWSSKRGDPAPDVWMCDVLHADGTPFDNDEMELVRSFQFDDP